MDIEMRSIDQIKPYDKNPGLNDDAVDAVANSITAFAFRHRSRSAREHERESSREGVAEVTFELCPSSVAATASELRRRCLLRHPTELGDQAGTQRSMQEQRSRPVWRQHAK